MRFSRARNYIISLGMAVVLPSTASGGRPPNDHRSAVNETRFDTVALKSTTDPSSGISVDETANGSTIQASPGQVIELALHSTYWHIDGSSDQTVVAQDAEPSKIPAPPGTCFPGVGCGVVHVTFTARQPGTVRISASRTLCGEILLCRPEQRSFLLTVIVR